MARIRADYVFGTTTAALTTVDTTLSSAALSRLPAIAAPDVAPITLHDSSAGTFEIVYVTAHTASATTATIARAAEGSSSAQAWASGTTWIHGPTAADLDGYVEAAGVPRLSSGSGEPSDPMVGEMFYDDDAVYAYAVAGADVSVNNAAFTKIVGTDVQTALDSVDDKLAAISSGGTVTAMFARVTKSAPQSLTAGSWQQLTWDTEVEDASSFHDNATNNPRFTIPEAGVYVATADIFQSFVSGNSTAVVQRNLEIRKNGVSTNPGSMGRTVNFTTGSVGLQVTSGPLRLAAGDYLDAWTYVASESWQIDQTLSWFAIYKIGD